MPHRWHGSEYVSSTYSTLTVSCDIKALGVAIKSAKAHTWLTPFDRRTFNSPTALSTLGKNTGVVVPPDVMEALGAAKSPPVSMEVNGYSRRTTAGVMGSQHLVSVSAAISKSTGLVGRENLMVTLTSMDERCIVVVSLELEEATASDPAGMAIFSALSNGLQRYRVDHINADKTEDTRRRRIENVVQLFFAAKSR
jgi:hypothetical protein